LAIPQAPASAADVTFAVIGPREYELPVNYKDFFAFVQYGEFNSSSQYFDSRGNLTSQPRQNLGVGLSKFVYFTTLDSLPGVGIALEAILPEVYSGVRGAGEQLGFGDTIWGAATWFKPNDKTTLGFQSFLQAPIGSDNFTNNYYANLSSIFFDAQSERLSFTGDAGGIFRGQQSAPGQPRINPGMTFHTNLRLGYKLNDPKFPVEPFVALDYQYNTASELALSHLIIPTSHGQDLALGVGFAVFYDPKQSVTVRYSRSVYGQNMTPTNAVYLKYVYIP
jgi:hypothetical protein